MTSGQLLRVTRVLAPLRLQALKVVEGTPTVDLILPDEVTISVGIDLTMDPLDFDHLLEHLTSIRNFMMHPDTVRSATRGESLGLWTWLQNVETKAGVAGAHRRPRRAARLLEAWASILPARVVNEDLGDMLELADRAFAHGRLALGWLRLTAALFWSGVNAVGYLRANLKGNRRGA